MKKEMTRKRSSISTVIALFSVFMMTAVMTLAGTFAVFADDTDIGQMVDKARDVSKKQDVTFRGSEISGGGGGPNTGLPPLPGHGQSGNHDADPDDISGTDDGGSFPDLSEFSSTDGTLYNPYDQGAGGGPNSGDPQDPSGNNSNSQDLSDDSLPDETGDNDLLSSGPAPNNGDDGNSPGNESGGPEQLHVTEKTASEKNADISSDSKSAGTEVVTGDSGNKSGSNDNSDTAAAVKAGYIGPVTADSGDKSSSSTDSDDSVKAASGSPQTGDSSGLADAVTLLMLSAACLGAAMHSRRNRETDMQSHY